MLQKYKFYRLSYKILEMLLVVFIREDKIMRSES